MSRWTAADLPPQDGKTALVTGANGGIGYFTALELARRGAAVVLACRSREKGEDAVRRLKSELPDAKAEFAPLDLADLKSVRACAAAWGGRALDVLVNNAGVMAYPERRTTADGFEAQLGTNHLGHFALTLLLLPALRRAPTPRVVTVSSIAHRRGRIDFDDLQAERRYEGWTAYAQSKLANLLFAYELQRRANAAGLPLRSVAAHPGVAFTNLFVAGPEGGRSTLKSRFYSFLFPILLNTEERGALPTLYAAAAPEAEPGGYYGPDGVREMRGWPAPAKAEAAARDQAAATRLWEVSERLTGLTGTSFSAA